MGLLTAFVAALAYGVGTILQARSVEGLAAAGPEASWGRRLNLLLPYAAGLASDAIGFVAAVVAVRSQPLFVVQSVVASSVAVTAVLAVLFLGDRLDRRDILALAGLVAGLTLLALTAEEGPARAVGHGLRLALIGGIAGVILLLGLGMVVRSRVLAATLLAVTAGLGFGGVAIAARVLVMPAPWWRLLGSGDAWAIVLYGAVALTAYGVALDRGSTTRVAAVTFAVETIAPSGIGLAVLGDDIRPGHGFACALGFVLTLAACLALARRAEPGPARHTPSRREGA